MFFAPTRRKLLIVCLIVMVAATAVVGYWLAAFKYETNFAGFQIRGSEEFAQQIEDALALLRDKSPEEFSLAQRYIKRIDLRSRSGMHADTNPPTLDLAERSASFSNSWCAGSIVHDAYHSKLYNDYRTDHGEPVPDSVWMGQAVELQCIAIQLRAMKNVGAPEFEIEYLRGLDGTHYDLDGDGRSTWVDYWKRDW